jgi:hypothetical protein
MAIIKNTIRNAGGGAQDDVRVTVQLSWDSEVSPLPRVPTEDFSVAGPIHVRAGSTGYWQADVVPNILIQPAGTVYKVTETEISVTDGTSVLAEYYVSVPDVAEVWVGDALVSQPSWED